MNKLRLWVCKKCGRCWHRKKKQNSSPSNHCGVPLEKGRTYPKRKISRYERAKERIQRFKDRYQTKPRTNIGTVLQISKETRHSFRNCLKAKQKPTFIKRANLFVENISKDIHLYQTPKDKENLFCKRIHTDGKIQKSKGGMTGAPIVRLSEKDMAFTHGLYTRAFIEGKHSITLNCKDSLSEMPSTLVHEVLHFIDANCEMDSDGHNYYWSKRLERFKKMLNY